MYLRDFQFVLRKHHFELYRRAREIWEPIELQVKGAIPKRFRFGGVGKIVLELGHEKKKRAEYRERLGVGLYHFEDFDVHAFLTIPHPAAIAQIIEITEKSGRDLCARFSTAADWLFDLLDEARKQPNQALYRMAAPPRLSATRDSRKGRHW
ncbi:MAG: hypothetical protein DME24_16450 [Verrucomicrobia bacterium]|nr:MAG: hypothetical protein DME24_16450 [Verrucomicrobiota bacterium]